MYHNSNTKNTSNAKFESLVGKWCPNKWSLHNTFIAMVQARISVKLSAAVKHFYLHTCKYCGL